MLKSYLTIAIRGLWKNKLHSLINVIGLAIGISVCLVIFLIVNYELGFDTFRKDKDRIYRVYSEFSGSFDALNAGVCTGLKTLMQEQFTGIEAFANFQNYSAEVSSTDMRGAPLDMGRQKDIVIVEPEFFKVFPDYQWLSGSPEASLSSPFQVVLTKEKADQYFGVLAPEQVIGREVRYRDSLVVTVSGIIKMPEQQTDLKFGDYISYSTIRNSWLKNNIELENWNNTNSGSQLFVKLMEGTSPENMEEQLKIAEQYFLEQNEKVSWKLDFHLQPFSDLHFNSKLKIFDYSPAPAHLPTLKALILVALLLLLIAAINYINLETARSMRRSKEIGVRKVLGSSKRELTFQFLGETFVVTALALLISLQITSLALNYFKEFIPEGVVLDLSSPLLLSALVIILLLVTLLSGLYPAFILSSFLPAKALKDSAYLGGKTATRSAFLRKGLIVFQFVFAQVLIFGTFIIGRQVNFMHNNDMGFDKDAIINVYTPYYETWEKQFVFEQKLQQLPEVKGLSLHSSPPATKGYSTNVVKFRKDGEEINHNAHRKFGDTTFIHLYDIPLIAGRNLHLSDTVKEFLINETFVKQLGFENPEEALGQHLVFQSKSLPIIGVVKDFHIQSMHNVIQPVMIANERQNFSAFSIKLQTKDKQVSDFSAALKKIENIWKELYPETPFEYNFLDEYIASFYESEQRAAKLMKTVTGLAIFISCLGLLGLISFVITQRTKEIGIRKILGASIVSIMSLLSKDFLKLVLIAGVIALPIAWLLINNWLENFMYRVEIKWWMFFLVALSAQLIAILTLGFQAIRAAKANPVEALRDL